MPADPRNESDVRTGLKRLEGKDRLGRLGEIAGLAGGVAAGVSAAGAVAGAAGATTLFGSTTAAAVLGGVLVTVTPVGWIVGCAAVGGATAYGIVKLARSGGQQDAIRERLKAALKKRLGHDRSAPSVVDGLDSALSAAVATDALSVADANRIRRLVAQGRMNAQLALNRVRLIANAHNAHADLGPRR